MSTEIKTFGTIIKGDMDSHGNIELSILLNEGQTALWSYCPGSAGINRSRDVLKILGNRILKSNVYHPSELVGFTMDVKVRPYTPTKNSKTYWFAR